MKFSDRKRPKNKATKLVIEFDEKKRADYLLGFKKRKDGRRKKAKQEVKQIMKAEQKRIRSQKASLRASQMKEYESTSAVFEQPAAQQNYVLPTHLVTVTDIGDVDFVGSSGTLLGANTVEEEAEAKAEVKTEPTETEKSLLKKKKKRTRQHVSYSHTHHHKRQKLDKDSRQKLKRKQKKFAKQHS